MNAKKKHNFFSLDFHICSYEHGLSLRHGVLGHNKHKIRHWRMIMQSTQQLLRVVSLTMAGQAVHADMNAAKSG